MEFIDVLLRIRPIVVFVIRFAVNASDQVLGLKLADHDLLVVLLVRRILAKLVQIIGSYFDVG